MRTSIEFLSKSLDKPLAEIIAILNRESGLLGLSGLSNDMRTLVAAAAGGHARARIAIEVFCYRLAKGLLALAAGLDRIDALVFTGGIGEHSAVVREKTLSHLKILGPVLDAALNENHGRESQRPDHRRGFAACSSSSCRPTRSWSSPARPRVFSIQRHPIMNRHNPYTLFLAPSGSDVGLTTMTLGLVRALDVRGVRVAFCKPIGQSFHHDDGPERSTHFIRSTTQLTPGRSHSAGGGRAADFLR